MNVTEHPVTTSRSPPPVSNLLCAGGVHESYKHMLGIDEPVCQIQNLTGSSCLVGQKPLDRTFGLGSRARAKLLADTSQILAGSSYCVWGSLASLELGSTGQERAVGEWHDPLRWDGRVHSQVTVGVIAPDGVFMLAALNLVQATEAALEVRHGSISFIVQYPLKKIRHRLSAEEKQLEILDVEGSLDGTVLSMQQQQAREEWMRASVVRMAWEDHNDCRWVYGL